MMMHQVPISAQSKGWQEGWSLAMRTDSARALDQNLAAHFALVRTGQPMHAQDVGNARAWGLAKYGQPGN